MFLLSKEDNNLLIFRERIEEEKLKVSLDFDYFTKDIINFL